MAKVQKIEKKTHAYILEDGTVVRAISEAHVAEYQKDKKTVYSCPATKTVDGNKVETENFYVAIDDFVKKTATRSSLKEKLAAAIAGRDLSTMSAAEVVALLS
jgi:hypothetical protein